MIWHRSFAGGGHSVLGSDPATAETPSRAAGTCRLRGNRRHVPECLRRSKLVPDSNGSSARVRGTARLRRCRDHAPRFIPACAGNRESIRFRVPGSTVHPRVCGEQSVAELVVCAPTGSSARVRGTARLRRCRDHAPRFIPACAGNRRRRSGCRSRIAVHPRVCGEQVGVNVSFWFAPGSSPRVRGTGDSSPQ